MLGLSYPKIGSGDEPLMKKKHIIKLTETERETLRTYQRKGKHAAVLLQRANILLKADVAGEGWADARIADAFGCSVQTVSSGAVGRST